MFKKGCYKWSMLGFIFTVLLGVVLLTGVATADINDQVALLDFDTATLDDVIAIFGEPIRYHW